MLDFYGEEVTHHLEVVDGDMSELDGLYSDGLPNFARLVSVPRPLAGVRATSYNDIGVDLLAGNDWEGAALDAAYFFVGQSADPKAVFPTRQSLIDYLVRERPKVIQQARRRVALNRVYGYDSQDAWMAEHLGYTKNQDSLVPGKALVVSNPG